jgi:hypothetical protein
MAVGVIADSFNLRLLFFVYLPEAQPRGNMHVQWLAQFSIIPTAICYLFCYIEKHTTTIFIKYTVKEMNRLHIPILSEIFLCR